MREWRDFADLFTGRSSTADGMEEGTPRQAQALLDLAAQLQGILMPVEPASGFRRRLHGDLILESQRRQPAGAATGLRPRKGLLIGAAVGSVASLAGLIIALVLRFRHGRATHAA